jgi:hypothetical protein
MCHIPSGFQYLAHNIFFPSLSMSNHNSQLTLHTDSHTSNGGTLRWEGRKILRAKFKILRAKYQKLFRIGHMFINIFLRMTDTITSQNIDLSSWDTLYMSKTPEEKLWQQTHKTFTNNLKCVFLSSDKGNKHFKIE